MPDLHGTFSTVVFDLPQLYTKPSPADLLQALLTLRVGPSCFSQSDNELQTVPLGNVSHYLTSIVASNLSWIEDETAREQIWNEASQRLSEQSGRTAMPAVTRKFQIHLISGSLDVSLHEPSLTADNLGLKTWASSFLLAQRLPKFDIPSIGSSGPLRILELGSGTGLVGIAAAALLRARVHLTDLPDIVPNLSRNVQANKGIVAEKGGEASAGPLDWSLQIDNSLSEEEKYPLILCADPLYSPEHPRHLVQTVRRWLQKATNARFIVELPLREAYVKERMEFTGRMGEAGLMVDEHGEEVGFDDWQSRDNGLIEVRCWWSVFKWKD